MRKRMFFAMLLAGTVLCTGAEVSAQQQGSSRGTDEMLGILNQTLRNVQDENAQLKIQVANLERQMEIVTKKNAENEAQVRQLQRQVSAMSTAYDQQMKNISKQLKVIASMPAPAPVTPPSVSKPDSGKKKNPAVPAPAAASDNFEEYVVKSGDTLGAIAGAYEVTVSAIKKANGMKSDRLHVGQKLKIPVK